MGIRNTELSCGVVHARVQASGAHEHGMGICKSELIRREGVHVLGESGGAADERVQALGAHQHGMGIRNIVKVG